MMEVSANKFGNSKLIIDSVIAKIDKLSFLLMIRCM